jgi:hypothetical protein
VGLHRRKLNRPGGSRVDSSERFVLLFTIEVTLDQILGNWYHFIKPTHRIKNFLTVKLLLNVVLCSLVGCGTLRMSLWNQGGGGPKKFGNQCFRRTFLDFVLINFKSGMFAWHKWFAKICLKSSKFGFPEEELAAEDSPIRDHFPGQICNPTTSAVYFVPLKYNVTWEQRCVTIDFPHVWLYR